MRAMATTEDRDTSGSVSAWREEVYERAPERADELLDDLGDRARAGLRPGQHRARLRARSRLPGRVSLHARRVPVDVPRPPVDDAAVRGLRDSGGDECPLPLSARPRADRLLDRVRHADADGLRLGSPPLARRGREEGVAVDSLADVETLFDSIPLGEVSTSMTINSPSAILLAYYVCVGEQQGVPRTAFEAAQTDILKEYIAQKEWIYPPEPSMRLVVDMIEFCAQEMPLFHPISISGYHIREAGSTAAQELAFTLADGFAYVEAAVERGLDVDDFAPRLSFFFNAHLDFFEEIAKYRAARRIWAREMRERFDARSERSC